MNAHHVEPWRPAIFIMRRYVPRRYAPVLPNVSVMPCSSRLPARTSSPIPIDS